MLVVYGATFLFTFCLGLTEIGYPGFAIAAVCDIRIATPESRFGFPIARTLGNCLSMENYSRCVELFGPSRVKEMIMRARLITAEEAHAAGFVHEIVPAAGLEARAREARYAVLAD